MKEAPAVRRTGSLCLLLAVLLTASNLGAQSISGNRPLGVNEISRRLSEMNARRKAALVQFESTRTMTVNYDGPLSQGEATETVRMTFTAPATKVFTVLSFTGSPFIQDNVFQRALDAEEAASTEQAQWESALSIENYTLRLVGVEELPIGRCYVLDVAPKTPRAFTYVGRVWVQAADFAVARIQGQPAINPSPWISQGAFTTDFQKVSDFYFPQQTVSTSQLPLGLRARLTIQYGTYRILSALKM